MTQDAADLRFELRGILTGGDYNHATFNQKLNGLSGKQLEEPEQDGTTVLSVAMQLGNAQAIGLIRAKLRS
ncbi:MAG: hypothetical protein ACRYGK_14350 [Janthinobacterium lividum]